MSEQHTNKLDNSEYAMSNTARDIAPAAVDKSEEERLYHYMRTLKMRAEIEGANDLRIRIPVRVWNAGANGGAGAWELQADRQELVRNLLPVDSEFEKTRKLIIIQLNAWGPEHENFRKYASRFGSNSTFELSSRITNYVLDEKRRKETYQELITGPLAAP
jgi:hypothetical protein